MTNTPFPQSDFCCSFALPSLLLSPHTLSFSLFCLITMPIHLAEPRHHDMSLLSSQNHLTDPVEHDQSSPGLTSSITSTHIHNSHMLGPSLKYNRKPRPANSRAPASAHSNVSNPLKNPPAHSNTSFSSDNNSSDPMYLINSQPIHFIKLRAENE